MKPCPHCGQLPHFTHHNNGFDGLPIMSVGCCARIVGGLMEITKRWNTRTLDVTALKVAYEMGLDMGKAVYESKLDINNER